MRAARVLCRAALLAVALPLLACAPAAAQPLASSRASAFLSASQAWRAWSGSTLDREDLEAREPSRAEWLAARARLASIRQAAASARTLRLALSLREPITGRTLEARGAVALEGPGALRMILLGPGGTTALDLWIDRDRYRVAVPAIELLRRGDATTPPSARRGLPIDFLRWWLLRPAAGTLLWAERRGAVFRLVLRDGPAIVELRVHDGGPIEARRATFATGAAKARVLDEETVEADAIGCAEVRYRQASTGLVATVRCEGEELGAPNPRAFIDPDATADPASAP